MTLLSSGPDGIRTRILRSAKPALSQIGATSPCTVPLGVEPSTRRASTDRSTIELRHVKCPPAHTVRTDRPVKQFLPGQPEKILALNARTLVPTVGAEAMKPPPHLLAPSLSLEGINNSAHDGFDIDPEIFHAG